MSIAIVDTETTGLPNEDRASVIELAAVILLDGNIVGSFSTLVKPLYPIGSYADKAMEVNKIDPRWLDFAPCPLDVWTTFLDWLALFKPIQAVTSYNVNFDREMMKRSFPPSVYLPWGDCIMRKATEQLGLRGHVSLAKAVKAFPSSTDFSTPHRALADAQAAAGVWNSIISKVDSVE